MWREAVYREREAVDKEREAVKGLLKREQACRDKERNGKWAAIKREIAAVHNWRLECQKREAAEHRVVRLQRMLKGANTHLLASTGRLSMLGILEASRELAEKSRPEEVAALRAGEKGSNKGFGAAWQVLLKHEQHLPDKLCEATEWSVEEVPVKLEQLRRRLVNPLYSKGLALMQDSQEHVQLLQLKDVTDEKDIAALQCLCTDLWCISFFETSIETYYRYVKVLRRTSA
eukprot:jgi/Ulvmu1/10746/UM068_0036.1